MPSSTTTDVTGPSMPPYLRVVTTRVIPATREALETSMPMSRAYSRRSWHGNDSGDRRKLVARLIRSGKATLLAQLGD